MGRTLPVLIALLAIAGLLCLSSVRADIIEREWTTTLDFDGGTKSVPTPADGNLQVETITDNAGIREDQLELASIKGDKFSVGDTDADTWKWDLITSGVCAAREISGGVYRANVTANTPTECGIVSRATVSGNLDVTVKMAMPVDGSNRALNFCLLNEAVGCTIPSASVDGLQYRDLIDTSWGAFTITNGVASAIGSATNPGAEPAWMRITRVGTRVIWYYSTDGTTWLVDETTSFATSTSLYVVLEYYQNGVDDGTGNIDDYTLQEGVVDIGGYRTGGTWTSEIWNVTDYVVRAVILSDEDLTTDYFIDRVALFSNGDLVQEWLSNVISGTLTVTNVTEEVRWNITVLISFKGISSGTPVLTAIALTLGPIPLIVVPGVDTTLPELILLAIFVFLSALGFMIRSSITLFLAGIAGIGLGVWSVATNGFDLLNLTFSLVVIGAGISFLLIGAFSSGE